MRNVSAKIIKPSRGDGCDGGESGVDMGTLYTWGADMQFKLSLRFRSFVPILLV